MTSKIPNTLAAVRGTRALAMAQAGKTWAQIAQDLGASYNQVYTAAKRVARCLGRPIVGAYGMRGKTPQHPLTQALRAAGFTQRTAAAHLKVHPNTLARWAMGLAIPGPRDLTALRDLLGAHATGLFADPAPGVIPKGLRGEYAYTERVKGRKWAEIGRDLGYTTSIACTTQSLAHYHAEARGLPWPIGLRRDTGKRAYDLRRTGLTWAAIAKRIGLVGRECAVTAAARYARAHDLQWPPE